MNETCLSFTNGTKTVNLERYSWKVNDRYVILIGTIILVGLLTIHVLPALGLTDESESKPALKQISKTKTESSYFYLYQYCHSARSQDIMGFQITSNVESVPVLISPDIKIGECQTYGAKIHVDKSDFVKTKLFTKNELPDLIRSFENKKMTLEDKLSNEEQKLNIYRKTDAGEEKIIKQVKTIEHIKELIKSARNSIILLKSA